MQCSWVGPGNSFLSPQPFPVVQTVVDSSVHASPLLSQVPECTWEIHNTIQVPERAVSMVFRKNRAIELQTSLSERDRMRVEGLRPLGTSMSGTC